MRIINPVAVAVKTDILRHFPANPATPRVTGSKSNDLELNSLKFSIICLGTTTKGAGFNSHASCSWFGVASPQCSDPRNVPSGALGGNSGDTVAPWWLRWHLAVSQHPCFWLQILGADPKGRVGAKPPDVPPAPSLQGGANERSEACPLGNKGDNESRCRSTPSLTGLTPRAWGATP